LVEVLPIDRATAEVFGSIVSDLRRQGRPIPTNEMWIAAACMSAGATLLTLDAHFREVPLLGALIFESE
jgi:predicted nucleic acid-binding protein